MPFKHAHSKTRLFRLTSVSSDTSALSKSYSIAKAPNCATIPKNACFIFLFYFVLFCFVLFIQVTQWSTSFHFPLNRILPFINSKEILFFSPLN